MFRQALNEDFSLGMGKKGERKGDGGGLGGGKEFWENISAWFMRVSPFLSGIQIYTTL